MEIGEEREKEKKHCMVSLDDVIEMVFTFDENGNIVYGNSVAKQKLEYGEELPGTHISEIFPKTFYSTQDGFKTEYEFGEKRQDLTAYRKNRTCFCVEVKILKQ